MSLLRAVGAFNIGTGAVGTTTAVTTTDPDSGTFQPKVILFWWSGRTENVDTTGSLDVKPGFGWAGSSALFSALTTQMDDGPTTSATDRRITNAACISCLDTAGAIDGEADLQSFDVAGFTLEIQNQFATNLRVHYLALGGTDITNVGIVEFEEPAATGNQDYVVGFRPDAVFIIGMGDSQPAAPPVTQVYSLMSIGIVAGSTPVNMVISAGSVDASADAFTNRYSKSGECIAQTIADVVQTRATLTQWNSDGFRLNWLERLETGRSHIALCLKGGRYHVGSLITRTDTGTITVSGITFRPRAVLFLSNCAPENTVDTASPDWLWSIGAGISPTERGAQGVVDDDAATDMECAASVRHDVVYVDINIADDTVGGLMDLQSIENDGFVCVMDDADLSAAFVPFMAFGDMPALTADPGSYTVTGAAATILTARVMEALAGSYVLTGAAATLLAARLLTLDAGTYTLSGVDATLLSGRMLTADAGAYVLTGAAAELVFGALGGAFSLSLDPGIYAIVGKSATFFLEVPRLRDPEHEVWVAIGPALGGAGHAEYVGRPAKPWRGRR